MAKTIDEAFRIFHTWLTPSITESSAAKAHRASIEASLRSNFEISRFWRTGSFGNGTSISGYSDVDYFASIPLRHQRTNSATMLTTVRDALDRRFPRTGVHVDSPAVVLPFGADKSEWTEVVPAYLAGETSGRKFVYHIPDGYCGWIRSSPDAHNAYVSAINDYGILSDKVKPLIRFIKAWKYYCNVPISSFYLELRVASYAGTQPAIIYSIDVHRVFEMLWQDQLAPFFDPMGVTGHVAACDTAAKHADALSKLRTALPRAWKARDYEANGRIPDAFYWWNLVYNGHFPAYG